MAAQIEEEESDSAKNLASSYLGISFSLFLAFLPKNSIPLLSNLQTQVSDLKTKLTHAEELLKQMKSRRKEDSKANARVVEIFASHRNAWQAEEKRLMLQIDAGNQEIAHLSSKLSDLEQAQAGSQVRIQNLEREVRERDEMISFMSRRVEEEEEREDLGENEGLGEECGTVNVNVNENEEEEEDNRFYGNEEYDSRQCQNQYPVQYGNGFNPEFLASASKFWSEKTAGVWQDVQYEPLESVCHMKHFVPRRESPWKVDGESSGVSAKLKLLEQELLNLENVGKSDLLKVPSLMRKQAKRYQALTGKIDDLCSRMQASDPCEPTLNPEFRTQRQTEFLLEAFRLQQRASETGQKFMALQTEIGKSYYKDELGSQAKLTTRRCLDSIRNNLKEIQRNLEIWLARIIGDLEGILARDGASRLREYYVSQYPFVQ